MPFGKFTKVDQTLLATRHEGEQNAAVGKMRLEGPMRAFIILRDALLALALGWLGISVETTANPPPAAPKSCVGAFVSENGSCAMSRRPGFDVEAVALPSCMER